MVREFGRGRPRGTVPLVTPRHPHEPADLAVTWYGHATSVVELDGRRFLLDPVFGNRASPSVVAGPKRLHPVPGRIAEIPHLDAVVISHDHYDHLDEPSIRQLERTHRPHYVVPLGVDAHLRVVGRARPGASRASTGARRPRSRASASRAPRPGTSPGAASCATRRCGRRGRCAGRATRSSSAATRGRPTATPTSAPTSARST